MVGGTIEDFFETTLNDTVSKVEFLVKENESDSTCTVKAEVPQAALRNNFIKAGQQIWWHNPYVLIQIEGVDDVKFTKIGFSSGNRESFNERKNAATKNY